MLKLCSRVKDAMAMKYTIISIEKNTQKISLIEEILSIKPIDIIPTVDDYLNDGHMQIDKDIKSLEDLFYDEYRNKTETLLIFTDMSKKSWRKLSKEIREKTFYPLILLKIPSS